jgi:D-alanine-D-alanine ligase
MCCVFGGQSPEYDVSLMSASAIIANTPKKYTVLPIGITRDGDWYLYSGDTKNILTNAWCDDSENCHPAFFAPKSLCVRRGETTEFIKVDIVFPAAHGAYCEDGRLQGLLETYGIPFVGAGCASSVVCMDKSRTKLIVAAAGIPQAKYIILEQSCSLSFDDIDTQISETFGYPVFVKPASTGSSVGVSKVKNISELGSAITTAMTHGGRVLIEQAIIGREIEVSVLGSEKPIVSVCGEVKPGSEFYCYDNKYIHDTATFHIPAEISNKCTDKVREYALKIYKLLDCRGLARVDFFVTDKEDVIFNEINTIPGFTPISMYPKMLMHSGMTYSEIVERLLETRAER